MSNIITNKPFSDTVKALLLYTKQSEVELGIESVKVCLGELYHPEMALSDVITVLCSVTLELVSTPEFKTPHLGHIVSVIVKAPIEGTNSLGGKIFGPDKEEKFTVEEFYNSMIVQLLNIFRFSDIGWCREYLFPINKGNN